MPDRDAALEQAIQQIATLFAEAYLRLRGQVQAQKGLDSPETQSAHVTAG